MNTNGNAYTVIYSAVLVILVAAILAFVAMTLQPMQNENVKIETITKVLSAAAQADESVTIGEDTDVMSMYAENIIDAFLVDGNGAKVKELNTGKEDRKKIEVPSTSDLKKQNDIIKKIEEGNKDLLKDLNLPVFVFNIKGQKVTVLPCYGAGLWGPIWGYIAVAEDGKTLDGAIFDHKGETPGLGAKIAEKPFYSLFKGKTFGSGDVMFTVAKAGTHDTAHGVDAISGATITSQALGKSINLWARYYEPYLASAAKAAAADTVVGSTDVTEVED